jgi:hypothetical protein
VSIYLKDNQLYVLTYHFGMPNLDKEEPIIFLKSPNRSCISEEPEDTTTTNVEDVPTVDSIPHIVMMNGLLYTMMNEKLISSKPILVSRINESSLEFLPSNIFKIQLIDRSGEVYYTCYQHFEYQQMYKRNGKLKWDVELIMEYDNPLYWESDPFEIKGIKYHNTLRKKD